MRFVWIAILLVACKSSSKEEHRVAPKPTMKTDVVADGTDDIGVVQPRFSGGHAAPSDEGSLGFTITKVHAGRKPAVAAPFHEAGGDWTYVEAHIDGDPAATFVVGMPTFAPTKGGPGFGSVMFAPTTKEGGAKVVAHLAKALRVAAPPPKSGGMLQALKVPIALLGVGIGKLDNGLGGKGTWSATKLFCSDGNVEVAELFFNISIATKQGELSEKDTDYNKDVVACLATVLRDGLPPPRTTANDPTLAATGPRLEVGKQLGGRRMQALALTPSRMLMLDERGTTAAVVEVDPKTGAKKDLFTTPDRLDHGQCDEAATRCVIKASTPSEDRNMFGGDDKSRLLLLEGAKITPLELGVESPSLANNALSPDARIIVLSEYVGGAKLVAIDRATNKSVTLAAAEKESIEVAGWIKEANKWVVVVMRTSYDDETKPPVVLDWHVEAKGVAKPSKRAVPDHISPLSPDGKRRAEFSKDGKLTVTVDNKPRTLALHAADARHTAPGCCAWIDNRLIAMHKGFIDTDTMKVSLLPEDPEVEAPRVEYVRGTRIAVMFRDDGVFLANLLGP